LAALYIIGG